MPNNRLDLGDVHGLDQYQIASGLGQIVAPLVYHIWSLSESQVSGAEAMLAK